MKTRAFVSAIATTVLLVVFTSGAKAQESPKPQVPNSAQAKKTDAAVPAELKTLDGTIKVLYEVISGPGGQKRDWDRFRSLFWPGARLIPTSVKPLSGEFGVRTLTPDEYVTRAEPYFEKEGFYENQVAQRTEEYGRIAHVWSTYVSRHAPGEKPFERGINSIQLVNDGQRWWIMTVMWQGEASGTPLPQKYLPAENN